MISATEADELELLAWRVVADLPMTQSQTDRYLELSRRAEQTSASIDWFRLSVWIGIAVFCAAFWGAVGYGINKLVMP